MSIIVVATGSDGILVASDGICYEYETGNVMGFVSKLITLPEYGCFIGSTGAGAFGAAFRWEIEQHINSYDDLVDLFADIFEDVHRKLFTRGQFWYDNGPGSEVSCIIGGWSDTRQAYETYRVVSYAKKSVDQGNGTSISLEPFVRLQLPQSIWCSFQPSTMEEFGLTEPLAPADETVDILARFVCAARADSGWRPKLVDDDIDRYFSAGGFLQMTIVQQNHIQSWIAHRWVQDQIGRPIDPSGPDRFPAWLKERYEQAHAVPEVETT